MAQSLTGTFSVTGQASLTNALDLSVPKDQIVLGSNNFDAIAASIVNGTGATAGACDLHWHDERSLNATTTENLDLAGGLTNPWGGTLTSFNRVKLVIIALDAPATGVRLQVGPGVSGSSNPWAAWFADVSDFMTVYNWLVMYNGTDGWGTITGGSADCLSIRNPTGSSIVYRIYLAGASA